MSDDQRDKDLFKRRFMASVPQFENGDRVQFPFVTRQWIVIFRRNTDKSNIEKILQQDGIESFRQDRNPLTYVLVQSAGTNRLQLFRKISRCRDVRYIGPYRNRADR